MVFATPIVVTGSTDNDVIGRTVRMPNGNLITVLERNPDWGSGDLYATISADDGDTWSEVTPIVTDAGNQSTFSLLVSPNDSLVLFYASDESGYYKIYSISSSDGINWSNKQQLDLGWSATQQIYGPMVICESDDSFTMVYIGWGGGAYIANCPYEGSWDQNKTLVQSGAYRARICKNEDKYLIAYHRNIGGNYDIHVKSSTDRENWSEEIDITTNGNSHDAYCNVTPDGKYLMYYAKHAPSSYNICNRISDDGLTWSDETAITSDAVNNTQPSFFMEGTCIYLTWTHAINYDTNNDIYLEKFDYATAVPVKQQSPEPVIVYHNSSCELALVNLPEEESVLMITDLSGRVYFTEKYSGSDKENRQNVYGLNKGLYIATLYSRKTKHSMKFVVAE
jgi:hypothetical protein